MNSSWIFRISFFLFFLCFTGSFQKKITRTPFILYKKIHSYALDLDQKKFLLGSLTGYKLFSSNTFLLKTGITHLLTPSGVHLIPFQRFFRKRIYLFIFSFGFSLLEGFFSLKRMLIFKILKSFSISSSSSFILTFLLSFFTHFSKNPFSFTLSFLFFGLLLSKKSLLEPFKIFLLFIQAQILVLYLFNLPFYPLSIVINPILTFLFLRLYPYLLINFWFSIFLLQDMFVEQTMKYLFTFGNFFSSNLYFTLDFLDIILLFYPKSIYCYLLFYSKNIF